MSALGGSSDVAPVEQGYLADDAAAGAAIEEDGARAVENEEVKELVPWCAWLAVVGALGLVHAVMVEIHALIAQSVVLIAFAIYLGSRVHAERQRELSSQEQGGGNDPTSSSSSSSPHIHDYFAWALAAASLVLLGAGSGHAYVGRSRTFEGAWNVLSLPFAALLAWAVTLPLECSPWPLFTIVFVILPFQAGSLGWLMEWSSFGVRLKEHLDRKGLQALTSSEQVFFEFFSYWAAAYLMIALPLYLSLHSTRRSLRRQYPGKGATAALSLRMGGEIASGLSPFVLYLSLQQFTGYSVDASTRLLYAKHDPRCQRLPDGISGQYGVPFIGCNLWEDLQSGRAYQPVYSPVLVNATHSDVVSGYGDDAGWQYVWSEPKLRNETWWHESWTVSRIGAPPFSANDTNRFEAARRWEKEGTPVADAAWMQGVSLSGVCPPPSPPSPPPTHTHTHTYKRALLHCTYTSSLATHVCNAKVRTDLRHALLASPRPCLAYLV